MYGVYLTFLIVSIVLYVICAYGAYCMVDLMILKHDIKKDKPLHKHINIFRKLFGVDKRLKDIDPSSAKEDRKFKKKRKHAKTAAIITTAILLIVAIVTTSIARTLKTLNDGLQAIASISDLLFKDDEDGKGAGEDDNPDNDWTNDDFPNTDDFPGIDDEDNVDPSNAQENAEYAVKFPDGDWCYWYHQISYKYCGCKYCGNWTEAKWGNPSSEYGVVKFGYDGCAVYSLAIAVSNVTGKAVNPLMVLKSCGVTQSTYNGEPYWKTGDTGCTGFSTGHGIYRQAALDAMVKDYGIKYEDIGADFSKIDSYLKKGAYIWIWYTHNSPKIVEAMTQTNTHFVCIRKKVGDNYIIIDECQQGVNITVSKQDLLKVGMDEGGVYAIYTDQPVAPLDPEKPKPGTGSSEIQFSTGTWFTSASKIQKATNYIDLGYGLRLYNGVPSEWTLKSDTYVANTETMIKDSYDWISKVSDIKPSYTWSQVSGRYKNRMLNDTSWYNNCQRAYSDVHFKSVLYPNSGPNKDGEHWDGDGCGTGAKEHYGGELCKVNNVQCVGVALGGGILDRNHCKNFDISASAPWLNGFTASSYEKHYNYGNKQMLAILQDSSGKVMYLPTTNCDAKGYTFPGDFSQTGVSIVSPIKSVNGKDSVIGALRIPLTGTGWGDEGEGYTTFNNVKLREIGKIYNYKNENYGTCAWDSFASVAEFWNIPESSWAEIKKYKLTGFVIWE